MSFAAKNLFSFNSIVRITWTFIINKICVTTVHVSWHSTYINEHVDGGYVSCLFSLQWSWRTPAVPLLVWGCASFTVAGWTLLLKGYRQSSTPAFFNDVWILILVVSLIQSWFFLRKLHKLRKDDDVNKTKNAETGNFFLKVKLSPTKLIVN